MESKILKDGFDYVFIDSGSPDSYLISNNDVDNLFRNDTNNTIFGDTSTSNSNNNTNISIFHLFNNVTTNGTDFNETYDNTEDIAELIQMAATSIVLGLMILITVIGNVFVIAAIILERNLQNVANYLVASLAVADLFVACLVMPLGAVYEISKGWILGPELCDIWTSCDVLCCTASILHLVAIATDRYWAVTNVDYMHSRTSKRVFTMIFLVWFASVVVSLAPQFGWKDPEYLERIEQQKCMVSQDIAYQIFATCCTFYVPLLVILVLYWKIYQTARKRIHRRRPRPVDITANNNQPVPQKKKTRLKFRIASKFSNQGKSAASSLGLVEGNSTNTVNTVEDTEFSSNVDSKKGVEITTTFNNPPDEIATSSTSQISTVSHLVANQTTSDNINADNQNSHTTNNQILPSSGSVIKLTSSDSSNNNQQQQQNNQISVITTSLTTTAITTTTTTTAAAVTTATPSVASTPTTTTTTTITTAIPITGASGIAGGNTSIPTITTTSITNLHPQQHQQQNNQHLHQVTPISQTKQNHPLNSVANPHTQVNKRKETLEAKRERKAAKTLAIITGAFVVCWLPFFLMALLLPLCGDCTINDTIASFFLWLGYFNSTLNPVIYTIFSPEFRQAFKRILFGGHRSRNYRSGKI